MQSMGYSFCGLEAMPSEQALLERAHCWPGYKSLRELTEETLRRIAANEGLDFATALLYDRIRHGPEHRPAIDRLLTLPDDIPPSDPNDGLTIAIVPGAFYVRRPDTGADGQFLINELAPLGYRIERIPVHCFGRLKDNARIIRCWLESRPDQRLILVSLSKGGSDVKMALAEPEAGSTFRRVIAWIDLSGMLWGTPLTKQLFESRVRTFWVRLLFWLRGYDMTALGELERGQECLLDFDLELPEQLQTIHVVGFSLRRHLTRRLARRNYRRLAPLGPNDSCILLADVCRLPGLVVPIWGADHFLRPTCDVRRLMGRLLHFLEQQQRSSRRLPSRTREPAGAQP